MTVSGFKLESSTAVSSLNLELRRYRHEPSGARHFHLRSADTNNAFMVAFPTLPQDSTGVAHILEHTTLCGSERFPVRDPFFMMSRRSLNTFMNAFTSSDSTAYPFATQNRKDFDNLLAVYLDAVFFPRLDPLDFAQEGWRMEVKENGGAAGQRLEYHGVVYNEMKGAMSSPVAQLWQHLHHTLFPDAVYRHNSGGDPLAIPELDYEALQAFHRKHYHPSNAVFMTYGNFPEEEHQNQFVNLVLDRYPIADDVIVSAPQPPFDAPQQIELKYAVDEREPRSTHAVWAWVVGETADVDTFVNAHFLSSVLLDHSASPLRHYLETTEMANAPSELCGIDDSACQLIFMCGVEGTESDHVEALQNGLYEVLNRVASKPTDRTALEAIVDRLEMAQRDIGSGGYPFGLQLMGRLLPAAMYRRDPEPLLDLDPPLSRLRQAIGNPDFVHRLVRGLLLENPHCACVVMCPDADKAADDEAVERNRLEHIERHMTALDFERVVAQSEALRARQSIEDDPDILPRVTLSDVPSPPPAAAAEIERRSGIEIFEYECGTNGIFRIQIVIDLPQLSAGELQDLPLFCEYLTELGHGRDDYLTVQSRRALTGNFSAHAIARSRVEATQELLGWLVVAGKGLARKRDEIMRISNDLLPGVRFDEGARLRELILQSRAEAEQSITDRGHHLAIATAANKLSAGAALDDLWDGPRAIRYLQELGDISDDELARVFRSFDSIRTKLLGSPTRVVLIGEEQVLSDAADRCDVTGLRDVEKHAVFSPDIAVLDEYDGWTTASQVNFCAKAYPAPAENSPDAPVLAVLGRYLQDGFLHGEIREKGGAYGSGASYDPEGRTFRFFSYRDPRALETLSDFDRALEWFTTQRDARRLEESILGTIRALDHPRSPAGEAERAFFNRLYGRDDQFRRSFRERVLNSSHEALADVADKYLEPSRGRLGVISGAASRANFEQAGIRFGRL